MDAETKKEILDFIKKYYETRGNQPSSKVIIKEGGVSKNKFYEEFGSVANAWKQAGIPVDQRMFNQTKKARASRKEKHSRVEDVESVPSSITLTKEITRRLLGISHLESGKDPLIILDQLLERDTSFRKRGINIADSRRILNFIDEAHEKGLETPWLLTTMINIEDLRFTKLREVTSFLEKMTNDMHWPIEKIPEFIAEYYRNMSQVAPEEGKNLFKTLGEIRSKGWTIEKFVEYMIHYREYIWALTGASANLNEFGMSIEDFRKAALSENFIEILERSEEFGFKILENYESDRISKAEAERDKAIAERDKAQKYVRNIEAQTEMLVKHMDVRLRFEKMIQAYLFSKAVNPDVLAHMIDKMVELDRMTTKLAR